MMDRKSKDTNEQSKKAVEEFLAKGGKITYCEPYQRTEDISYTMGFGSKKKKKEADK